MIFKKFNCKVPYIGSELFYYYDGYDWENENLNIPNNLFSNKDNNGILIFLISIILQ